MARHLLADSDLLSIVHPETNFSDIWIKITHFLLRKCIWKVTYEIAAILFRSQSVNWNPAHPWQCSIPIDQAWGKWDPKLLKVSRWKVLVEHINNRHIISLPAHKVLLLTKKLQRKKLGFDKATSLSHHSMAVTWYVCCILWTPLQYKDTMVMIYVTL